MRKLDWDKKYFRWGSTLCLALCGAILFYYLLSQTDSLLSKADFLIGISKPIIYGLAFGYLLSPIFNFFDRGIQSSLAGTIKSREKLISVSRSCSTAITVALAVLLVALLFRMVVPELASSIYSIIESTPEAIKRLGAEIADLVQKYPEYEKQVMAAFNSVSSRIEDWVQGNLFDEVTRLVTGLSVGAIGFFNAVMDLAVGIIVCVYVLNSKEVFCSQSKKLCYGLFKVETANRVIEEFRFVHMVFGGFIGGKLLDSLIIGIIAFVCLTVMGMPYVLLISVIIGVTNVIPFFGPFIGAIPSALLILMVDPIQCLYFVIFILILQQVDGNIIGPKILGDSTGLSSFWVIFAILIGGGAFGFIGMILGIPCFAVLYHFIKAGIENALERKGLPQDTTDYIGVRRFEPKQ